jgi:hypothetical protein
VLSVSSTLRPKETDPAAVVDDPPHAGGCAWLAAWLATGSFGVGGGLLLLVIVTENAGAYGLNAVVSMVIAGVGVAILAPAALAWLF